MTESGIRRQKLSNRLRNRNFFVGTLWRRATFRVSGGKWQRFSFFLTVTKTKKQLPTKNFAYAQYDALKYRHSANCLSLRQNRNGTNRVLEEEARGAHPQGSSYVRLTPASEARSSYAPTTNSPPQRLFAYAQYDTPSPRRAQEKDSFNGIFRFIQSERQKPAGTPHSSKN